LHTTAITAAGNIGPAAKDAVPFMIAGLRHSDSYVKQESIRALGRMGPAAAPAVPALEEARRTDTESQSTAEIDRALASIRGGAAPGP
jgi:HEAT repeat protein